MKKNILLIILICLTGFIFAQEKKIEIQVGEYGKISLGDGDKIFTYNLTTDEKGIINNITAIGDPDFNKKIVREGNRITIQEGFSINDIKWEGNNVYIKGNRIYSKDNDYRKVIVNPKPGVIYEHEALRLEKLSKKSLEEIFKIENTDFSAYLYKNNTLYDQYKRKGNLDYKYIFNNRGDNRISITYYYYGDEHSPDIEIKGDSLYSENMVINIINNYILLGVGILQPYLFPLLFLENPFEPIDANGIWNYISTSYLTEKNTKYDVDNLSSADGLPWASGNGYGIGDKIYIDMNSVPKKSLTIINGFVSKERPDLFIANSRVKQIKITDINSGSRNKIITLEDTMSSQTIDVSTLVHWKHTILEIEILSVYPGKKYKDLCIQAIY